MRSRFSRPALSQRTRTPACVTSTRTSSFRTQNGNASNVTVTSSLVSCVTYGWRSARAKSGSPWNSRVQVSPGRAFVSESAHRRPSRERSVSTGALASIKPASARSTTGGESSGCTSTIPPAASAPEKSENAPKSLNPPPLAPPSGTISTRRSLSPYPVGTYTATCTFLAVCAHM